MASSAFLRNGDRNLKSAVRSCAYMGHPFCCGVSERMRPMKTRCDTISSHAYANPGLYTWWGGGWTAC